MEGHNHYKVMVVDRPGDCIGARVDVAQKIRREHSVEARPKPCGASVFVAWGRATTKLRPDRLVLEIEGALKKSVSVS
jgi:hypothetical protein